MRLYLNYVDRVCSLGCLHKPEEYKVKQRMYKFLKCSVDLLIDKRNDRSLVGIRYRHKSELLNSGLASYFLVQFQDWGSRVFQRLRDSRDFQLCDFFGNNAASRT